MHILKWISDFPGIRKLYRIIHYIYSMKLTKAKIKKDIVLVNELSPKNEILGGIFKGIKYPSLEITESSICPKIIGVYELQVQHAIEKLSSSSFSDIINIGSAEGYYSVGLAKRFPDKSIHCYEIENKDIEFNKLFAKLNNCENLYYYNKCTAENLLKNHNKKDYLILSDCEGYEFEIFTKEVITNFRFSTFIIELHPFKELSSDALLKRFSNHTIQIINNRSILPHNGFKALLSDSQFYNLITENRGGYNQDIYMEWAIITSNTNK